MLRVDIKFPCPICQNGEGKAKFNELSLERHLDGFHKRVDASQLTDWWVSNRLHQFFVNGELTKVL